MNKFGFYDIFVCFLSCATYIADVGTDVGLIIYLFVNGHQVWGATALTFVVMATLMMQIFSFHWHIKDKTMTWKILVVHLLFLAPLHRYIRCLKVGQKFRETCHPEDLKVAHSAINDICILRLFETFLESAPMLTLQLYIIFTDTTQFGALICLSSCLSLLSLAWSLTAYSDALHIAYEKFYKRTALSIISQMLWQLGIVVSRVFAIVLFATVFHSIVFAPLGIHLILMIVWITIIKPDFGTTAWERRLFTLLSAIIHTFCFLNVKDGPSRWRMLVYYVVMLIENSLLIVIWFVYRHIGAPEYLVPLGFSVVFGGFAFGVLVILLYYGCCHSSGPVPIPARKPEFHKPPTFVDQSLKTKMPIFEQSSPSARINQWLSASLDLKNEGLCENPDDDVPRYTSLQANGNLGNGGDHGYSQVDRTPADFYRSEQWKCGVGDSPDSGTNLMGQKHLQTMYLETYFQSPRSGFSRADDRLDYETKQTRLNRSVPVQDCTGYSDRSRLNSSQLGQDLYCGANNHRTSHSNIDSKQFTKNLSQGVNSNGTSQKRSDLDRSLTEMVDTNETVSDYNLVEMFSRCKLDPCYVSDSTVNDSVFHISPAYSPMQENSTRGNSLFAFNSNGNSMLRQTDQEMLVETKAQEFTPTSISPLDPFKLWEESEGRIGMSPGIGHLFYQPSPDQQTGYRSNDTGMITILPDESRGISLLSLSYSGLDNKESSSSSHESLRKNPHLVDNTGPRDGNRSADSVYINHTTLNKSGELTFSNMSLPLPDSSDQNRSQRSMLQTSYGQGELCRTASSSVLGNLSANSPYSRQDRDRSLSSYRDDSSPVERHSSYSSDRGLSLSDRAMTSGSDSCERSKRSFTSSGFQSEESNMSGGSPTYLNQTSLQNQYHPGGLLENEIISIRMAEESVHRSVYEEDFYNQSLAYQNKSRTYQEPTGNTVNEENANASAVLDSNPTIHSADPSETVSLPPLVSRPSSLGRLSVGSSALGRFFKDPTLSDDSSEKAHYPVSTDSSLKSSQNNEQSSVSAMIADLSSSRLSDLRSSDESLSTRSDKTMSSSRNVEANKDKSLPYIPFDPRLTQDDKPYSAAHFYENIDKCQRTNTTFSPKYNEQKSKSLPPRLGAANTSNPVNQGNTYMNLPKGRREDTSITSFREEHQRISEAKQPRSSKIQEQQRAENSNLSVEEFDDSPHGLGRSVDLFNRERWRASLDKAMKERLQLDLEKLAPRKLYKLQSKNAKKTMPPMVLAEYNDSPYKFRKSANVDTVYQGTAVDNLSKRFEQDVEREYENIENMCRLDANADTNTSPNYLNFPPDYENVFNSKELLCPMARPESLTNTVSSGRNSAENYKSNVCSPLYSPYQIGSVRAELCVESLSSLSDSLSSRSEELSRTKSPINTTGVNSAFKPVVPKTKSSDSLANKPEGNKTFTVLEQSLRDESASKTRDLSNVNLERSLNNSGNRSQRSDTSRLRDQSDYSFDRSSYFRKSRRHSDVSRSKDEPLSSLDQSSFARKGTDKSRRRSDISQSSYSKAGNDSVFQYSSDESSTNTRSSHSFNYLNLVGYPEKYKLLDIAADDYPKSHSCSDSIPWEDSVNKSFSFQNTSDLSFPKSAQRQPLKALENTRTPTISPIYGQDLRRQSLEMLARKRFMSTPKMKSPGSDLSISRNSDEGGPYLTKSQSRDMSASSRVFDTTSKENTSTWSTQQSLGEHSSLSKTTYI